MKQSAANAFDLVAGVRLSLAKESNVKLTLTTVKFSVNDDGIMIPGKFIVELEGTPKGKVDEAAYAEFKKLCRMINLSNILMHGLHKWEKLRHDTIVWFVETYYKYPKELEIKFRVVPTKGDKNSYIRIENAFGLCDDEDEKTEVEDILDIKE